jgi:hypothetical protein
MFVPPHFVEGVEVVQVGEEHLRLDHALERGAGGRESLLEVVEDVARLQLDVG